MIILINIITTIFRYDDLIKLLLNLKIGSLNVIFSKEPINIKSSNIINIYPYKKLNGIKYYLWILLEIYKRYNIKNYKLIVIEHHTGNINFILKILSSLKVLKVEFKSMIILYSENINYLFKMVWKNDIYFTKIDTITNIKYSFLWCRRVIIELLGVFFSDYLASNSNHIFLQPIIRKFRKKKIIIPNPIEVKVDIKFRFKEKKYLKILYVGTIMPAKGLGSLFKLSQILNEDKISHELILIGNVFKYNKNYLSILNQNYANNSILHLNEVSREELDFYYNTSDLFVFPSLSEGSARVILEASLFGLPIIANDCIFNLDSYKKLPNIKFIDFNSNEDLKKIYKLYQSIYFNKEELMNSLSNFEISKISQKIENFLKEEL